MWAAKKQEETSAHTETIPQKRLHSTRPQRGSACGLMQKCAAGKFHLALPFASLFDHLVGAEQE
jgi:hypothetical protein